MEAEVFWDLVEGACRMGRFVAAVPNAAASANIVGRLETGYDGDERVLQKRKRPNSHVHFKPELISEFAFIHLDPGTGPEPCLEIRTTSGQPALRLYYQGKKAVKRYDEFMKRHAGREAYIKGSWAQAEETNFQTPAETNSHSTERATHDAAESSDEATSEAATTADNETIFVGNHNATDAEDSTPVV